MHVGRCSLWRICHAGEDLGDLDGDQASFKLLAAGIGHGKQCLISLIQVVGSATVNAEQ